MRAHENKLHDNKLHDNKFIAATPNRCPFPRLATTGYARLLYLPETTSTNDVARAEAVEGAPEGTVVVTDYQRTGRGRDGRQWSAPRGAALLFSVVLRPTMQLRDTPLLVFLAAAAVREAVAHVVAAPHRATGSGSDHDAGPVLIKWPNDVVTASGRKLAGILLEMDARGGRVRHCIVGIGVNVNETEDELHPDARNTATSVRVLAGNPVERSPLLRHILVGFWRRYAMVHEAGVAPLLEETRRYSATTGRPVRVYPARGEPWDGWAEDIASDGALLVGNDADGAPQRVYAADVSIRPLPAS